MYQVRSGRRKGKGGPRSVLPRDLDRAIPAFAYAEVTTALLITTTAGTERHDLLLSTIRLTGRLPRGVIPNKLEMPLKSPRTVRDATKVGVFRIWLPSVRVAEMLKFDEDGLYSHPVSKTGTKQVYAPGEWTQAELVDVSQAHRGVLLPPSPYSFLRWERMSLGEGHAPGLSVDEREVVYTALADSKGPDMRRYPERLGGIIVATPEERFTTRILGGSDSERLGVEFRYYGDPPPGLTLTVSGRRMGRTAVAKLMPVTEAVVSVDLDTPVEQAFITVFDRSGAAIHANEARFMRTFNFRMTIADGGKTRAFHRVGAGGAVDKIAEVRSRAGSREQGSVGNVRAWETIIREAERQRKLDDLVVSGAIVVLEGGAEGRRRATEKLRAHIGAAHEQIWFIDPYFGGSDLLYFCSAIVERVDIRVLSEGLSVGRRPKRTAWEHFVERLLRMVGRPHRPEPNVGRFGEELPATVEALVASGLRVEARKVSGLHDRFLVCDGKVWVIGHSFNRVGQDFGAIVEFPHPELALKHFEQLWIRAAPFLSGGSDG